MNCSLCTSNRTKLFSEYKKRAFYLCLNCDAILLHPSFHLNPLEEKGRYDLHSDDVLDIRYQNFVKPIVEVVEKYFPKKANGLDFGCGKTAIVKYVLEQKGYTIEGYDPVYFKDESLLQKTYNYITSCEVVEHFYNANKSFNLLNTLLKSNGKLILKTSIYSHATNFENWWYKNDPTHVIFYTEKTLLFIKQNWEYKSLRVLEKCIVLSK